MSTTLHTFNAATGVNAARDACLDLASKLGPGVGFGPPNGLRFAVSRPGNGGRIDATSVGDLASKLLALVPGVPDGLVPALGGMVTAARVGKSTGQLVVGGTPNASYPLVVVRIVEVGTNVAGPNPNFIGVEVDGVATFPIVGLIIPIGGTGPTGSLQIADTGIWLTFMGAASAFDLGDQFTFSTTLASQAAADPNLTFLCWQETG
ncbi:MAG TPA: hypothetical protein VGI10_22685 [Polyangiaceae bacterium]